MPTTKKKPQARPKRDTRLSLRIDADRSAVISKAAKLQGASLSDFVLENAFQMASVLMIDEGKLKLTKSQVAELFRTLDNPPAESVVAYRKLMSEPTVLDE